MTTNPATFNLFTALLSVRAPIALDDAECQILVNDFIELAVDANLALIEQFKQVLVARGYRLDRFTFDSNV